MQRQDLGDRTVDSFSGWSGARLFGKNLPEEFLQTLLGALEAPAIGVYVRDCDRDVRVFGPTCRAGSNTRAAAQYAPGLAGGPLEVHERLRRGRVNLGDEHAIDPEFGRDLNDSIPLRILRPCACHDLTPESLVEPVQVGAD